MSIVINNVSYVHPDGETLFSSVSLSVASGRKASLIGDNGTGKSTLIGIIRGSLHPSSGEVSVPDAPYFVPQHFGQYDGMTIAGALGIEARLRALRAIIGGDLSEENYTSLNDDWGIEERTAAALEGWGLGAVKPETPMSSLSGGEKTKVFLAGIDIHSPGTVLMDEPTNHLDAEARRQLYAFIQKSPATMLIVSHDRQLLNLLDTTFELTPKGVKRYGGNYDFYKSQRDDQLNALQNRVEESEKAVRAARKTAREATERKERMDARGEKKQKQAGIPRIMMNSIRDGAEKSGTKLREKHTAKIETTISETRELRGMLPELRRLKIALDDSALHRGKTLVAAEGVNFGYTPGKPLWSTPLDFRIFSGDRVLVRGGNGAGKTTLVRLITGALHPAEGTLFRADFSYIYIDQEYSLIDNRLSVLQQLERYNSRNLPDHELRTELHRFLFPAAAWDKPCGSLSGGEKMRLALCCILAANDAPDMLILDEPTNNLDISSMEILTAAVRGYSGTVLLISHDARFAEETGITSVIGMDGTGQK